jgi:hypothetical protein
MTRSANDTITARVIARAKKLSGNRIPVDVEEIARACGVTEISVRPIPLDGYLARRPDGQLAIRYSSDSRPTRARFTIAHEIGHLVIAEETNCPLEGAVARGPNRSAFVERLANRFASEILMPEHHLEGLFRKERLSWAMVNWTADSLKVSREAMLRRLMELTSCFGVEIRIPLSGTAVRRQWWFSGKQRVLLTEHPRFVYSRLLDEMKWRSSHSVRVVLGTKTIVMPLLGRMAKQSNGDAAYRLVGVVPKSRLDR